MVKHHRYRAKAPVKYKRASKVAKVFWKRVKVGTEFTVDGIWREALPDLPKLEKSTVRMLVAAAVKNGFVEVVGTFGYKDEWCKDMPSVKRWLNIIQSKKMKYIKYYTNSSLDVYMTQLKQFNAWLAGRTYTFIAYEKSGKTFVERQQSITFNGVEDLVKYLNQPFADKKQIKKLIIDYLHDDIHEGKAASTIKNTKSAILSFLNTNEFEIDIKFNAGRRHTAQPLERSMDLGEFLAIIQKMDVMDKALMLCKFQRGLDSATLVDRFNHEAWTQMTEYFGTENHRKWNTEKCPVPITLIRIKTNYKHTGFLDIDAVNAVKVYLDKREKITGKPMEDGKPLFLTRIGTAINSWTIDKKFRRAAKAAGVAKEIGRNSKNQPMMNVTPHETRDLLKSTLINAGCRYDVADHVIGHKPKDSYEKQAILYSDSIRAEYSKASKRINVVTNLSNVITGKGDQETQAKIEQTERNITAISDENSRLMDTLKRHEDMYKTFVEMVRTGDTQAGSGLLVEMAARMPGAAGGRDPPKDTGAAATAPAGGKSVGRAAGGRGRKSSRPVAPPANPVPVDGDGPPPAHDAVEGPDQSNHDQAGKTQREVVEYQCAKCEMIHDGRVCPDCGSSMRRVWHG